MTSTLVSRSSCALLLATSMLLAGCLSPDASDDPNDPVPFLAQKAPVQGSQIGAVRRPFNFVYRTDPAMLDQIRSAISGKTILVWDKSQGTQVEYYAPNGRAYLWYGGNTSVVSGRWTVEVKSRRNSFGSTRTSAAICTQYSGRTFNPVTKATGATPECSSVTIYKIYTDELAPGDPFRLASGRVPFVIDNDRRGVPTLDELYAQSHPSR